VRDIHPTKTNEIRLSLAIAWGIASFIILMVLVAPFVMPAETIFKLAPRCQWKAKYQRECPLCGTTRAFVLISEGRFREALDSNRFSLCLYSIFALNEIAVLAFSGYHYVRRCSFRRNRACRSVTGCV